MREYNVFVYNYRRRNGRNRPLAYLRFQGPHSCQHRVSAETGPLAKKLAISEHLASPACDQADPYASSGLR